MWLLLVAAGSGYLARCWRNALQQRPPPPPPPSAETDCNQDDSSKEQQHPFDPLSSFQAEALGRRLLCDIALIASSTGDNSAIEPAAKMTNQAENAKKTGMKVVDSSFPRRTTKRLFDSSAGDRTSGEVFAPRGSALESSLDTTQQDILLNERGTDTGPVVAPGKRTIDFSNRAVHDGEHAVGFEVKRMRDSHEFKVGQGQEQGLLSAFTFLDNPGFNALWFAPQDGEARNGLKSKTPSRSSRVRGVLRRPRYLRASPKPVSSLESCLRAQLRFQGDREENRVSRSLFFQPYGEGSSPGLGEVETLHTHMGPDFQLGGGIGLRRKHAGLPLLGKPSTRRTDLSSRIHTENSDKSSHDALLFSFGVGVGVLHMLTSNKSEIERLNKCLKEAQSTVQDLQLQIESRGNAEEPPLNIRCDSKHVETASNDALTEDHDSAPSGVTAEEQDNIAELEAQLEAELELMQLQSAPHHERITELDADDLAEVVHDELTTRGLPGVFDVEDDKNQSGHAEGNVSNWAVSPRELDKRLRMLLESRQEERILQLEEELQDAEGKLHCKEQELQLWKDRVRHLTEISISSSGESFSLKDEEVNSLKEEVTSNELHLEDKFERPVEAEASHPDVSHQGPKHEKAMDPNLSDDICDEFLKCVDSGSCEGLDNVGLEIIGRELRSDTCPSNISDYAHFSESWQDVIGLDEHESCSKGVNVGDQKAVNIMQLDTKIESSAFQTDGTSGLKDRDKLRTVSTSSNEFELDLADSNIEQERRAISAWNRNFISHAGANTPIVDFELNKLFNTPRALRARGQEAAKDNATVLEKIKYWESLAKGSEVPSSPEGGQYSQTDQISPVPFSCSEGNSSWEDSSVSDPEEHLGDVLIKRIVEKSRKGSALLRDVQTMLAALDGNSR